MGDVRKRIRGSFPLFQLPERSSPSLVFSSLNTSRNRPRPSWRKNKDTRMTANAAMRAIGLIGGMSWESTVSYYRIINTVVKEQLGGLHSAKCILYSVDFQEIETCQAAGQWDKSAAILRDAAQSLERAGADFIVICTNTMHKVADQICRGISIPLLHIAEETARELARADIARVGLLGTKYTMEQDFYKEKILEKGIEVLIPDAEARANVNRVIYEELCLGGIKPESRRFFQSVMAGLSERGAQGIILGCTEIALLVGPKDSPVPLFDTTAIHARAAALRALRP